MEVSHVLNCQFAQWYQRHRRWTIRSKIIPLSEDFVAFLNVDGIDLPANAYESAELQAHACASDEEWHESVAEYEEQKRRNLSSQIIEDEKSDSESGDEAEAITLPEFDEIEQIRCAIAELGGDVFPKLNWSAPRDAAWIVCSSTLKCSYPSEVLLLLKASDFIAHDLSHAFEKCVDADGVDRPNQFTLVLRQWADIVPSREFRCFVANNRICGISQKDHTNFYEHLIQEGTLDHLRSVICAFFAEKIQENFPDNNYVFDVYVDGEGKVFLIDFGPFGEITDAQLFDWEELRDLARIYSSIDSLSSDVHIEPFDFRVVQSQGSIGPSTTMMYQYPKDVLDMNLSANIEQFAQRAVRGEIYGMNS